MASRVKTTLWSLVLLYGAGLPAGHISASLSSHTADSRPWTAALFGKEEEEGESCCWEGSSSSSSFNRKKSESRPEGRGAIVGVDAHLDARPQLQCARGNLEKLFFFLNFFFMPLLASLIHFIPCRIYTLNNDMMFFFFFFILSSFTVCDNNNNNSHSRYYYRKNKNNKKQKKFNEAEKVHLLFWSLQFHLFLLFRSLALEFS